MECEIGPRRSTPTNHLFSWCYLSLVAVAMLVGSPRPAASQALTPAVGDSVRVVVSASDTIEGTVASMNGVEWVLRFGNEERMSVDPTQVGGLEIRRTHSAWKAGAWIGGLLGAVVGATVWASSLEEGECTPNLAIGCTEAEVAVRLGMGGVGGALGALVGAAVGSAIKSSAWMPVVTAPPGASSAALELSWHLPLTRD